MCPDMAFVPGKVQYVLNISRKFAILGQKTHWQAYTVSHEDLPEAISSEIM